MAIRVPSKSFTQALRDAGKLGTLKNQSLSTQDVTEEYVDLEARIKNSEANVDSLVALLGKAKTVDEILQVQSVLTSAQQDLEPSKGRMRYLEEHTSYSTITMSIYEVGVEVVGSEEWGVITAFKDGAPQPGEGVQRDHPRALGVLIPVLVVLAIIAYIVYLIVRAVARRNRAREQARYQRTLEQEWRPAGRAGQPARHRRHSPAVHGQAPAPGAAPPVEVPAAGATTAGAAGAGGRAREDERAESAIAQTLGARGAPKWCSPRPRCILPTSRPSSPAVTLEKSCPVARVQFHTAPLLRQ